MTVKVDGTIGVTSPAFIFPGPLLGYVRLTSPTTTGRFNVQFPAANGIVALTDAYGALKLTSSNGGTLSLQPPNIPTNTVFRFPATNGIAGSYLTTDGAGVTSWSTNTSLPITLGVTDVLSGTGNGVLTEVSGKLQELSAVSGAKGSAVITTGTTTKWQTVVCEVDTIAALRALSPAQITAVSVLGYYAAGDGGGGEFYSVTSGGPYTDNGGTIITTGLGVTVTSAWLRVYSGDVNVKWFGAKGDSASDDTSAINRAVQYCQTFYGTLCFPIGEYLISSTIVISGNPIVFYGQTEAIHGRGSTLLGSTITWTGGASPMFQQVTSNVTFTGFSVWNKGTATDFLELPAGAQSIRLKLMTFLVPTGTSRFSRSVVYSNGNRLGYSEFSSIYCLSAAPKFIYINGAGTSNGITPFSINERSIFESNSLGPMTVIYVQDEGIDQITITESTFNQQGGQELTIVDTTDTPLSVTIGSLTFSQNEWDNAGGAATDRMMRLTNVPNFIFEGNQLQGGGTATALIEMVNSNLASCNGNYASRIAGPMINADSTSYVNVGLNVLTYANTRGVLNDTAEGIVNVAWAAGTVTFAANKLPANKNGVFLVEPTSAAAWTWSTYVPISGLGYATIGQVITIMIKNTTAGAISAGTPSPTYFRMSSAPTAPAAGFSLSYTFVWNGTHFIELYRSAADVPN
jgi:hypothetical protein